MTQPESQSELDRRDAGLSPLASLRVLRSLFVAVGVSLMLHLAFLAAVYFQTGFRPPLRMEFEASSGVGMMSNEGMVPYGASYLELPPEEVVDSMAAYEAFEVPEEIELPDPVDTEAGDGGDTDDENTADEEAEAARLAEQRALARRAHRDQLRREAQEQALRDRALALRQQRERESAALAEAEARAAEEAEEQAEQEAAEEQAEQEATAEEPQNDEPQDAGRQRAGRDLAPAQRYPEGTLNPIATDVGMWGPESARIVLIMRNDRIRQSPHAESVRLLLSSFPDWNRLLGHTDVDPLTDIDTLMIASSDPRWVNQTFLAAVHQIPPAQIVQELEAGFPQGVTWRDEQGRLIGTPAPGRYVDPRMFVLPTENLFVYSRPEFIAPLLTGSSAPVGLEAARLEAIGTPEEEEGTTQGTDDSSETAPNSGAPSMNVDEDPADRQPAPPTAPGGNNVVVSPSNEGEGGGGIVATDQEAGARPDGTSPDDPAASVNADTDTPPRAPNSRPPPTAPGKIEPSTGTRRPAAVAADSRPPIRGDGWMRGLLELADFGGPGQRGTAVQLTMAGFAGFSLSGLDAGLEPSEIHLSITASANPVLQARFVFEDGAQAEEFIRAFPNVLSANRAMLMLSGMNGPLTNISWGVDHNEAIGVTSVSGNTLRRIATTVHRLLGER